MGMTNPNATTLRTGNGTATDFYFDFKIEVTYSGGTYFPKNAYDITVYVDNVKKTYTTDYVLVLESTGYGRVSFNSPPANNAAIKIVRWNYAFLTLPLPQNANQMNSFITVITSGMFCYNRTEIFSIYDKYKDKWQPVNSLSYNHQWFNDYSTDKNPASSTDFEKMIEEAEAVIGKENISGFSFHVPWYWRPSDDAFVPMNSIIKSLYEGQYYLHFYKKAKDEGVVYYDSTPMSGATISVSGNTATVNLTNHGAIHGMDVTIAGVTNDSRFNGTHTIWSVTTNTFNYTVPTGLPSSASGTVQASFRRLVNASGTKLLTAAYSPTCGGTAIGSLAQMPMINNIPIYGGTPDDAGLQEALAYVKTTKGYKFIFYAFTEVADITKPWRGNLLPSVRTIPQLLDDIKTQCTYYAQKLADWDLKPYAFITCSEMKEINRHKTYTGGGQYTDDTGNFDFTAIAKWKEIYDAVKAIFVAKGWSDVYVGYACDWSELNGFTDSQGYYWRQLDELMMYQDAVFIDAYYPVTEQHSEVYQDYLDGWTEGREWDYYVTDYDDWKADTTAPYDGTETITADEYRVKNLSWWWNNTHDHVGKAPTYTRTQTPWTAQAKPILFTEMGCPSINSGATEPNLFYDPQAVQGGISKGSTLLQKDIVQYYYLKAAVTKMNDSTLPVKAFSIWQHDSRPYETLYCLGAFFWGDSYRVPYVHWLKIYTDYYTIMLKAAGMTPWVDVFQPQLNFTDLYKIQFGDGNIKYFTSHDKDITYQGTTYTAIPIKKSGVDSSSDLSVDKISISVGLVGITVGASQYTIPQVIDRGWLRNAHVWIYLVDWSSLLQHTVMFDGFVSGDISYDRGVLTFDCNSILDKLNEPFPKIIYTELCPHKLYDVNCGVNKASYKVSGAVVSSANRYTITASMFNYSSYAQGYWLNGEIKITEGDNNGVTRTIKIHNDGFVVVRTPFPANILDNMDFDAYPGCDQSGATCQARFNNYNNFLGFEYIPRPETVFGY